MRPVLPKTRGEAIDLQEPKFFTGKPCKRGHIANRYTVSGSCLLCASPKIRRDLPPARNQFRLTSFAHVPGNVTPTPDMLTFFNIKLQQSCPAWYAEYVEKQKAGASIMGALMAAPLRIEQLQPTEKATAGPLEAYVDAGWTPAQLVANGYATVHAVTTTRPV